jgi:hypothetical protein
MWPPEVVRRMTVFEVLVVYIKRSPTDPRPITNQEEFAEAEEAERIAMESW